jgi:hypothetical protein
MLSHDSGNSEVGIWCGKCSHKRNGNSCSSRLHKGPALKAKIENWANQQKDKPSRSEAIRRLIEFALEAKPNRSKSAK